MEMSTCVFVLSSLGRNLVFKALLLIPGHFLYIYLRKRVWFVHTETKSRLCLYRLHLRLYITFLQYLLVLYLSNNPSLCRVV